MPGLANVLSDQRLATAARVSDAATDLNAEIARVRESNAKDLDGFFAVRSRVDQLVATLQELSDKDTR